MASGQDWMATAIGQGHRNRHLRQVTLDGPWSGLNAYWHLGWDHRIAAVMCLNAAKQHYYEI